MRQIRLTQSSSQVFLPRSMSSTSTPRFFKGFRIEKSQSQINLSASQSMVFTENTFGDTKNQSSRETNFGWTESSRMRTDRKNSLPNENSYYVQPSLLHQHNNNHLRSIKTESDASLQGVNQIKRELLTVPDLKQIVHKATTKDLALNLIAPVDAKCPLNKRDSFRGHLAKTKKPDQFARASPFLVRVQTDRSLSYNEMDKRVIKHRNSLNKVDIDGCLSLNNSNIENQKGNSKSIIPEKDTSHKVFSANNIYKMKVLVKQKSFSQLKSDILLRKKIFDTKDITGKYVPILKSRR